VFRAWARRAPERSLTIVRPTVVFGPWQPGQRPSAPATDRARPLDRDRRRAQLEIDGYVGNLAEFLVHALGFAPGSHL
jgi:nucleoside-diphosphate-sugar epimerase